MRPRRLVVALTLVVVVGACSAGRGEPDGSGTATEVSAADATSDVEDAIAPSTVRDLTPYEGLGTWVDVFDYAPAYQPDGEQPSVTPESVADMAALGISTLYLQAARDDERSPDRLVDTELTPEFLVAAHEVGVQVVAWYLPRLDDVDADLGRLEALLALEVDGHRFDGVAVDIEDTQVVEDHAERNRRLVELSSRLDEIAGDDPIGAIVLPPVVLEVVNDRFWPAFPWRQIAPHYDVWMPMSYWTMRSEESGYHDGFVYTDENVRRMLANLGDDDAVIHPIGGIGDRGEPEDLQGFVRAATTHDAIGWSVYDYDTLSSAAWPHLRPRP